MGEIILHDPFRELHGKLSKKNGRVTYMRRDDLDYDYTGMTPRLCRKNKRALKAKQTQTQKALQKRFAAASRAARKRMYDPTKTTEDAIAFKNQKTYPTLFGYLFSLEWEAYEE